MAEARVPWPFFCSLTDLLYSRQEFYHFHFICGYQDCGNACCWYPLIVNQPLPFCNSKMTFLRVTRPFFGPSLKPALSFEMQHDIAVNVPRECRIPLRWIGCFFCDSEGAENPMYGVSIRSIGGDECKHYRDQDRYDGLPIIGQY